MSTVLSRVDSVLLFKHLATRMDEEGRRFERLGDVDIDLAIVMHRPDGPTFRVLLEFRGISCHSVREIPDGQERAADCWLEGMYADFQAMFDDISANGGATGAWTLNTLTLFGDRISLHATDPVGEDRFHRFNQTLQEFFDGAGDARTPDGKE